MFAIIDDELVIATTIFAEERVSYSVRVRATDQDGLSAEQIFTVFVGIELTDTIVTSNIESSSVATLIPSQLGDRYQLIVNPGENIDDPNITGALYVLGPDGTQKRIISPYFPPSLDFGANVVLSGDLVAIGQPDEFTGVSRGLVSIFNASTGELVGSVSAGTSNRFNFGKIIELSGSAFWLAHSTF